MTLFSPPNPEIKWHCPHFIEETEASGCFKWSAPQGKVGTGQDQKSQASRFQVLSPAPRQQAVCTVFLARSWDQLGSVENSKAL